MVCHEYNQLSLEQVNCCEVIVFTFQDDSERDAVELVAIYLSIVAEEWVYSGLQVIPVETLYLILDDKTIVLSLKSATTRNSPDHRVSFFSLMNFAYCLAMKSCNCSFNKYSINQSRRSTTGTTWVSRFARSVFVPWLYCTLLTPFSSIMASSSSLIQWLCSPTFFTNTISSQRIALSISQKITLTPEFTLGECLQPRTSNHYIMM